MPFFSIIIPTWNSGRTVVEALNSILTQSFIDFEIIIKDGMSTDGTIARIKEIADDRVIIVSEPDYGIYDAMNRGLVLCKGKWVYFMGSDDTMYSNQVLSKIYNEIIQDDPDIVYGNVISERFGGVYDGEFSMNKLYNQNICHQSIFIKREVFQTTGFFNLKYIKHSDWDNNLNWFLNPSLKKKFIEVVIANYADGGFSSESIDKEFEYDKPFKYFKYGKRLLDKDTKINLCITMANLQKRKRYYFSFIITKIRMLLLRYS